MTGTAISITEVPDASFSKKMLGNGIAINPTDGKVFAPCDAVVSTLFPTGHAITLKTSYGTEILIHVGLDTVTLKGKPFTTYVSDGDVVKKGQLLLKADLNAVNAAGLNTITPMVICNTDKLSTFNTFTEKYVTNDDIVIELAE